LAVLEYLVNLAISDPPRDLAPSKSAYPTFFRVLRSTRKTYQKRGAAFPRLKT
jgi:hypothetical protein